MLYPVEYLLIPENYVRIAMKTETFDKYMKDHFEDDPTIYEFKGIRYLFFGEDCVIEEQK